MTREEQGAKGSDYCGPRRITRDRKMTNKRRLWAATATQLKPAKEEIHAEVSVDGDGSQYYNAGSQSRKQRKIKMLSSPGRSSWLRRRVSGGSRDAERSRSASPRA